MDPNSVLVVKTDDPVREAERVAGVWSHLHGNPGPVLFKPNLIHHRHLLGGDFEAVVTQPSVLDLAWETADLLELSGPRAVADAPQGDADFDMLLRSTGLDLWSRDRGVRVVDLRQERFEGRRDVIVARHSLPGDPMGGVLVDLGRHSAFHGVTGRTYYGSDYDIEYTNRHHRGDTHVYSFSGTALHSGVVIDLPKLKTHKKAGVTLSLKNLVGLNTDKNLLPHHSLGTPRDGGDAYDDSGPAKRFEAGTLRSLKPLMRQSRAAAWAGTILKPIGKRVLGDTQQVIRSGNWWGNDTIWRMILDLNRILRYARPDGTLADEPQRFTVSLVDGIVAGEGNGPEAPDRVDAGVIVAGTDFVAVDIVATTLMGLDYRKVPHLVHALQPHPLPITSIRVEDLRVESNVPEWRGSLWEIDPATLFQFRPHFGWLGHLEREVRQPVLPGSAH